MLNKKKKSPAKRATSTKPTKSLVRRSTTARAAWADKSMKCMATLTYLATKQPKQLAAAIKAHVDDDDCYLSKSMRAFLVAYPLKKEALATITFLLCHAEGSYEKSSRWMIVASKIIPLDDGESDPFPIKSWADIARLPALEEIVCVADDGVLPSAADIAKHPALAQVTMLKTYDTEKQKAIAKLVANSGFHPDELKDHRIILKRDRPSSTLSDLMLILQQHVQSSYTDGKSFQLDLLGAKVVDGKLRVWLRLYMHNARGNVGAAKLGELDIVPADGTEATLKANGVKLRLYIEKHRKLPASL